MDVVLPQNEGVRLHALRDCDVIDTGPERVFDDLAALAASICAAPMAGISFIDANRQFFKAAFGFSLREVPREIGFCSHTIHEPALMLVGDALLDVRFAEDPLVKSGEQVRSYAGAPLILRDGCAVGTLFVMDRIPRELSPEQREALMALARQATALLEQRRDISRLQRWKPDRRRQAGEWQPAEITAVHNARDEDPLAVNHLLRLADAAEEGIWLADLKATMTFVNRKLVRMLGYAEDELLGHSVFDFMDEEWRPVARRILERMRQRISEVVEFPLRRKDGSEIWTLISVSPLLDAEGNNLGAFGLLTDITQRRRAEQELRRLNRALRAISEFNQILIRADQHTDLPQEICRIVAQVGGYRLVWVGLLEDDEAKSIRPAARAGFDEGYLDLIRVALTDPQRGSGPVGTAVRTGKPRIIRSMANDPSFAPWREEALRRGFAACLALPLTSDGRTFGALSIYSAEAGVFDAQEVKLLTELANDLAYGMMALELKAQRARSEEALRELNERTRYIIKHNPNAIAVYDRELRYLMASDRYLSDYRIAEQDIIGRHHYEVFPEIPDRWRDVHQRCLGGAIERAEEDSFVRPDGSVDYNRWECRPWYNAQGQVGGIITYTEVITERKRAEEAIKESERRFRDLFETANDVILFVGVSGHILAINKRAAELTGYTLDELHGMNVLHDLIVPEDRDNISGLLAKLMEGQDQVYTVHWRAKDGRIIPFEGSSTARFDANGAFRSTRCILRDLTGRVEAEAALRASEERLRSVVQNMPVMMDAFDESGRIIVWNGECERVTGYAAPEIVGNPRAMELLCPNTELLREGLAEWARRGNDFREWVWPLTCKDGSVRHISWSNVSDRFPIPGWSSWSIGIDVTERKRMEEQREQLESQLRQAQKMEAIGQLAAGVAHDFNNLLTAILCNVEMLQETFSLASFKSTAAHEAVGQIRDAGERAAGLTRQLLTFSRRQVRLVERLDLNGIVEHMDKLLQRLIGEHIALRTELARDLAGIRADAGQIEQVVMNLVVNARDAMPEGGELVLMTENVVLDETYVASHMGASLGAHVRLSVRDTGVGMSAETMSRMFEPFFTTKPLGQGTGLGLATVYGIVKQAEGHLAVESRPGRGSCFRVYLPATDQGCEPEAARDTQAAEGGSETILVCEDQDMVRRLASRVLQARNYRVLEAADGEEALRVAATHAGEVKLLVTDVVMPGMNGNELARRLLKLYPQMRVLLVSGYAPEFATAGEAIDFQFLQKPYQPARLLAAVRDALLRPACTASSSVK